MANEIFISYSRRDFVKVYDIKKKIDSLLGIDCWMDINGIESGAQFANVITAAINRHSIILFMRSRESMNSEWAINELEFAKEKNKRIIIVGIDNSPLTDSFLFLYKKYDQIDWSDNLQQKKLLKNLEEWLTGNKQRATTPATPLDNNRVAIDNYNKGCSYLASKDFNNAFRCFKMAADMDDPSALYALGFCYERGHGTYIDYKTAFYKYKKAADLGNINGMYAVGCSYYNGTGVAKNESIALDYFKKAAALGSKEAIDFLKKLE